jgi:hypothetical protein
MEQQAKGTSFITIYDSFLAMITSEMYMEFTEHDTYELLQELLLNAINKFRFPKFDIYDYVEGYLEYIGTYNGVESDNTDAEIWEWVQGYFAADLTKEEINILATNMVIEWLGQQLANTELTQEKYSGSDYKFTSQANHMAKLKNLIEFYNAETLTKQDIYKRRHRTKDGMKSTLGKIMETPSYGYNIDGGISLWS